MPDATEDFDLTAPELTPHDLPDDVLVYLMPSRYCLPDMLGNEAWSRFSSLPPGYTRVQAICQHVNDHLQFAYGSSCPTSTAVGRQRLRVRGLPRLHPPGDHLLPGDEHPGPLRVRLPAGHGRADRPEPDGLRRLDGGLARRPLVDLRPPEQRAPQGPHPDRPRARRLRRRHGDVLRRSDRCSRCRWSPTR